jgi:alanine racemase
VKVDTGMHRVGAAPADVLALVEHVAACAPAVRLTGLFTHLAVADEPADPYTAGQLAAFDRVLAQLPPGRLDGVVTHAANSAGGLAHPDSRRSFVRAGIAVYGVSPGPHVDHLAAGLRPVLALRARVSFVKRLEAGARLSYGLRHTLPVAANVATVPLGYADGVGRGLSNVGEVLIGGRRRKIIGTVTMDQLMVDCGDDPVQPGDEVVLIGRQGDEQVTAEEWAQLLGTIGYEIVCGIGPRVPRRTIGGTPIQHP